MERQAVAVHAVKDVEHARSLAVVGDRVAAVYAAHKSLEEDLPELSVRLAETRRRHAPTDAGSWSSLVSAVESFCQDVELCLQLFSIRVKVQHSKGFRTVSVLYDEQKIPADRLRNFFLIIRAAFTLDDVVMPIPAVVIEKFARAVCVFDARQASEWAESAVHSILSAPGLSTSPDMPMLSVNVCHLLIFGGDTSAATPWRENKAKPLVLSLLTLLVQCEAKAGNTCTLVHQRRCDLCEWMDDVALESLLRFELDCLTTMSNKKLRIQRKAEKRRATELLPMHQEAGESRNFSCGEAAPHKRFLQSCLDQLLKAGWMQKRAQIVVFVVKVLIFCVLARYLASGVSSWWRRIMGSSSGARKMLTL